MSENVDKFIAEFAKSVADGTFVKLTLGNYKGAEAGLQKLLVRLLDTKKGKRLFFLYRYETRDTAKNYEVAEALFLINENLDGKFLGAHLFTTANDFQLDIGRKNKSRLNTSKPTFNTPPPSAHDRQKQSLVNQSAFYLKALGITDDTGRVRDRSRDKWRQINKFVEVLAGLIQQSSLTSKRSLRIVDMGCGKGYLTFAVYDHLASGLGIQVSMTGVDTRPDLIEQTNSIAKACGFEGLEFVVGSIADYEVGQADVVIALHACDTATDDAIYKGIAAGAKLIVAAPCCHREIRTQIKSPEMLRGILKHAVLLEREAETLTDGLRSLLLEREGYATKLFEFVATEHTPKNNMLVGRRLDSATNKSEIRAQIDAIKSHYSITSHRLETLLDASLAARSSAV